MKYPIPRAPPMTASHTSAFNCAGDIVKPPQYVEPDRPGLDPLERRSRARQSVERPLGVVHSGEIRLASIQGIEIEARDIGEPREPRVLGKRTSSSRTEPDGRTALSWSRRSPDRRRSRAGTGGPSQRTGVQPLLSGSSG